jgi:hypothetical protein
MGQVLHGRGRSALPWPEIIRRFAHLRRFIRRAVLSAHFAPTLFLSFTPPLSTQLRLHDVRIS